MGKCQGVGEGDCRKADAIVVVSGGDTNARTVRLLNCIKKVERR